MKCLNFDRSDIAMVDKNVDQVDTNMEMYASDHNHVVEVVG